MQFVIVNMKVTGIALPVLCPNPWMKWSRSWADPNNPQDPKVQLSSNITIPAAEFVDHMKKEAWK